MCRNGPPDRTTASQIARTILNLSVTPLDVPTKFDALIVAV
jgi:hypothetical protein